MKSDAEFSLNEHALLPGLLGSDSFLLQAALHMEKCFQEHLVSAFRGALVLVGMRSELFTALSSLT